MRPTAELIDLPTENFRSRIERLSETPRVTADGLPFMHKFTIAIATFVLSASAAAQVSPSAADPERMEQRIRALSEFGRNGDGGVDRVAYSDADVAGREFVSGLMREVGLTVRTDTAGNIIGRRAGTNPRLPPIMFGSHIDSVPGGGNYDGDVGVIGAIEVAQLIVERGIRLAHPIEVVVFADEEGALAGSRAMIGKLTNSALDVQSHSGLSVREGIRRIGGDPEQLELAVRRPDDIAAFIELHIEQGAVLDEADVDIGVVEGIVGIRWWDVTIEGFANHAGTTPMNQRRDALVTAAELTLAVSRIAREMPGRQVATVGRIHAFPGAPNVIPGNVVMSLEIRDLDAAKMQQVFDRITAEAARLSDARSTPIAFREIELLLQPAPTDVRMRRIISRAAAALGLSFMAMPSGAGHDAQDMATIAPTGMIFVPSVGGISHSPQEFTSATDMANGANVLLDTVLAIDGGALQ